MATTAAEVEETLEFSTPLPHSLDNRIYIRLTIKSKAVMVFLTTASGEEAGTATPMGSFVYAFPDKFNPNQPLSTPLFVVEATLEFATRLAKLLAKKVQLPVFVGNSISLASTGLGGTMEEEMEAFKAVVEVLVPRLTKNLTNGA